MMQNQNVTEFKRTNEKLRQLLRAVEQSGSTIVITGLDATIEYVNPAFTKITGYSYEEAIGQNPRLLQSGKTSPEIFKDLWATITRGEVWQGEFINKKKNGELYWETATISPVKDDAGNITHYVAVKEDITQRKREENIMQARLRLVDFSVSHSLEELLQATLDEVEALTNSTIGFYHFLEADQNTLWLQAWSTNTLQNMYTAEGQGLHYDVQDAGVWVDCVHERRPIIHNDYAALPHVKGTPEGHEPVIRELVVPVMRGNQIMAILGVGNKPHNYDESDIEIVSRLADLAWDITERKRAEESLHKSHQSLKAALIELKETQKKMVQQERLAAVGQLAAGIAHDFNNILTGILGFAELLQISPEIPAVVQADLQRISASSHRAAQLIRQILDFSQKTIRHPQKFDLVLFTQESVKFLERTIPESIQISLDVAPGDYLIEADPTQMQQVITNLAVNARDAMPSGGMMEFGLSRLETANEINYTSCGKPINGEWVCLTVTDMGSGIPLEVLSHIFEPFFTTKGVGKGVGLGLSQVYGIISQHDGHITVNSQVGGGTTITVCLPPAATQNETVMNEALPKMRLGWGETILLVEDEPGVLDASKAMLERLNYQVMTATNGQEALAIYQKHKAEIALVLSDMIMPDMDGETLFYALKTQNPDIKMVIMSGYPLQEKGVTLMEQGVLTWFEKPMSFKQLSQVVGQALSNRIEH